MKQLFKEKGNYDEGFGRAQYKKVKKTTKILKFLFSIRYYYQTEME